MNLNSSPFQCSEWCHAATLLERLEFLRTEQKIKSESEMAERAAVAIPVSFHCGYLFCQTVGDGWDRRG
jgi:hypothetical protein